MARRQSRDMSLEEFDAWSAATKRYAKIAAQADERGGPTLSMVPVIAQEKSWPTDLLLPAARTDDDPAVAMPFDGVDLPASRKRHAGWSADRQRLFLESLAETGSVHLASAEARLTARSAYRLRTRSPDFAAAWDTALQLSVGRLAALVFDRAINGRVEQVYRDGDLIGERRLPSDKLLTWLLARLDPKRFALPWEQRGDADPQVDAVAAFPALLDALPDMVDH